MKKNKKTWEGERFWTEIIENKLYPPEAITLPMAVGKIIFHENFKGKKVLDLGCGTGRFGKLVQDKGADVIGVDISGLLLKTASKKIKTKQASCTELPFEDNSFDYVLCFMMLQILKDPELKKTLSEIKRVLKTKGKLFFGIVHPKSEKWDVKTKLTIKDNSTYDKYEKRLWIFHLIDGRIFEEYYIHKPLEYYTGLISKFFSVKKILEPQLPKKYYKDGKYAKLAYFIGEAKALNLK